MRIKICFHGGPLHGMTSSTSGLPQLKLFWPPLEKRVLVYQKENETEYLFSKLISDSLTAVYDAAKERFHPVPEENTESFLPESSESSPPSSSFFQ